MEPAEVKALLVSRLEDCDVEVTGDGRHFDLLVIGDIFAGLTPVKRQQLVYGALRDEIASGALHAVNMKTLTRAEWAQRQAQ
jgi:acid stress-induced BolA-like protein IbaG/YrbA